jgi:hypothetical protein
MFLVTILLVTIVCELVRNLLQAFHVVENIGCIQIRAVNVGSAERRLLLLRGRGWAAASLVLVQARQRSGLQRDWARMRWSVKRSFCPPFSV